MKFWQQGVLLLGLPLLCQLVFSSALVVMLIQVDSAIQKETRAKQVITCCQEIRFAAIKYISMFAARQFLSATDVDKAVQTMTVVIAARMQQLQDLVNDDPPSRALAVHYGENLGRFKEIVSYASSVAEGNTKSLALSRFINEPEYYEELMLAFNNLTADERSLQDKYAPIVSDLQPKSLASRASIRNLTIAAVGVDTAIVALLVVLFGKQTLTRLRLLMSNIRLFEQGEPNLVALTGKDELAELDAAFREMARNKSLSEDRRRTLVAMITHDLRSPITSATLTMDMILEFEAETLSPSCLSKLRKTSSELHRLVRLTNTLLDVDKLEGGKMELELQRCFAAEIIVPSINAVSGMAEVKKVRLNFDREQSNQVLLFCDPDRVIQVLVNLLSNAIKFSPANSEVNILIQQLPSSTRWEVRDQGPGISKEDQLRLFEKFTQLDQSSQTKKLGSGLGLYIAKSLAFAHGGSIGCSSPESGGTCFWFDIPVQEQKPSRESED